MHFVLLLVNSLTLREVNTVAVTLATQTLSDRKQWKYVWKEIRQESNTGPVDVVSTEVTEAAHVENVEQ